MYDIAIIGAGPAGATLARLVGDRYRTLLVDRRRLGEPPAPGGPSKLCGGLLAPAAQAELARQGLGIPASVIAGPQLFAVGHSTWQRASSSSTSASTSTSTARRSTGGSSRSFRPVSSRRSAGA